MRVQSYRDLMVWQRALDLVCEVYLVSRLLPAEEIGALSDQLRRSAVSVPANIAEGHARRHRKEFLQFLGIAHASLAELETHLAVAERVGYTDRNATASVLALSDEVSRMLTTMRARLGEARLGRLDAPRSTPLDARRSTPGGRR